MRQFGARPACHGALSFHKSNDFSVKNFSRSSLCALACALCAVAAHADASYSLGVVSLYKSNGLDQDTRTPKSIRPAIQGSVENVFENGFYLGNWNSTGSFGKADIEIDLYGGHRGKITDGVGYDIGMTRFLYPSSGTGLNGNEVFGSLLFGGLTVKYTQGVSGVLQDFGRLSLGYTLPLNDEWSMQGMAGFRNREAGHFNDYTLGLDRNLGDGLIAGLQWSGATKKVELGGKGDDRLIISLIKRF